VTPLGGDRRWAETGVRMVEREGSCLDESKWFWLNLFLFPFYLVFVLCLFPCRHRWQYNSYTTLGGSTTPIPPLCGIFNNKKICLRFVIPKRKKKLTLFLSHIHSVHLYLSFPHPCSIFPPNPRLRFLPLFSTSPFVDLPPLCCCRCICVLTSIRPFFSQSVLSFIWILFTRLL